MNKAMSSRPDISGAVAALDDLRGDGENLHHEADKILRAYVPEEIRQAYERVLERADFWAYA